MKGIDEANYILEIHILRDRKYKCIALSQALYIDKILVHFATRNSKKGFITFRKRITLSKDQYSKTPKEEAHLRRVP